MRSSRSCCRLAAWLAIALLCVLGWMPANPAYALDPNKAFAQYVANSWSIQDGLPQISVMAITQDRDGYIWVGTQNGLARFDGVRFTNFTPDTEPQLPGIWIRTLLLDRSGKLWIGTYKGLAVYADGRFEKIPPADAAAHPALDVNALAQSANGDIIAATSDGVMRVADSKLTATRNAIKPALSLLVRNDGMWVGGIGAVMHVDAGKTTLLPLPPTAATTAVTRLVEANGRIWAATSQGLYVSDGDAWKLFDGDPKLASSPIGALFEDHDHNLWAGANTALMRLRDGRLVASITGHTPVTYKDVRTAFEDREGNLWFGSQVEGLIRLWNGWTQRYSVDDGLADPVVWSLSHGPDGTIWVGSSDGVSVLEHGHFTTLAPGSALPHPQAYNLLAEADRLWIGTRRGLAILHDGHIETPALFAPMAGAQINGIVRETDGTVWFPTTAGLFRLDHSGQPDERLRQFTQADGLIDVRVRVILRLRDGRMLVGTEGGLFELQGERLKPFATVAGLPRDIDITSLHQLPSGAIAIGTMSEQLFVFDDQHWSRFGPAQGVPTNATFFMAEDDRGYLWLAGIRGISRVPLVDLERYSRGQIRNVRGEMILNERGDRNSGQQGYCCNGAGMSKGFIDGHVLWLPSRDGVVALDTHGIVKNLLVPNVVIERLSYLGGWHAARSIPAELDPNARDLVFEFTAPSYQDPHSIQIRYRLVGYDNAWHVLDDARRRSANYTNLPAGDYVFEVAAANNAGVWNPANAQLKFRIRPRFHETQLFKGLVVLLIGALVYAGSRRQWQMHQAQRVLLEQQVFERTQQLHISNERLENASQTDPLTGLRNRRYLANQIPADLAFYDREQQRNEQSGKVILFVLVNIDHFTRVNERHGQKSGDRILQQFAQMLAAQMRSSDYVVRWDSDEFLLVSRPMPATHVKGIGDRIHAAIERHAFYVPDGQVVHLTASIGISQYPLLHDAGHRPGWEQMVELADTALHWVKQRGRNGWAAFRPGEQSDLAGLLRDLHHDPQVLLDSGRAQWVGSIADDAKTSHR